MKKILFVFMLILIFTGCIQSEEEGKETEIIEIIEEDQSIENLEFKDFLEELLTLPENKRKEFFDKHFEDFKLKLTFPVVEGNDVTFIYIENDIEQVSIQAGFTDYEAKKMTHILGTDMYYNKEIFKKDARIEYEFIVRRTGRNYRVYDPLNGRMGLSGISYERPSELMMPEYPIQEEVEYYKEIAHGRIEQGLTRNGLAVVRGSVVNIDRRYHIYFPPNYNELKKYKTIYFQDGRDYLLNMKINNVLDYMIDNNEIEPVIAVFIECYDRNEDYINEKKDVYLNFLVDNFIPYIENTYPVIKTAASRFMVGFSNSGAFSYYAAYKNPEIFGNILIQSSAFDYSSGIAFETYKIKNLNLNFKMYQVVGIYEPWLNINREFNTEFNKNTSLKGHKYLEVPEGHTLITWRNVLREGLIWIFN